MAELINKVSAFWNLTTIVIIYGSNLENNHLAMEFLNELHQKNNYSECIPRMTFRDVDVQKPLYDIPGVDAKTLVLTLMHTVYDNILKTTAMLTRNRRTVPSIYLLHTLTYVEYFEYLFRQLWKFQLRRSLVIMNARNVLTIDPYPILRIVNVTLQPMAEWFPRVDGIRDFRGYTMNMPIQSDIPSTYIYKDERSGKFIADGLAAWIINELMARLNVSLNVYPLHYNHTYFINSHQICQLLRSGEMEISPHVVSFVKYEPEFDFSYPYTTTTRCIMMPPVREHIIAFRKFLNWKLFLFLTVMLLIYEFVWHTYLEYCSNRSNCPHLYRPFYIICILLGVPMPAIPRPTLKRLRSIPFIRILLLYFLITFTGNYSSTLFSSNLSSFLTASYFKTPSPKLQEILSSNIPIIMRPFDAEFFMKYFKINTDDQQHFVKASYETVYEHRSQLNTSFMYLITRPEFDVINEQQRYLHTKRFILTDVCHGPYPLQFQLASDNHFLPLLQLFVLRLREAGITKYQRQTLFQRAKKHGKIDYIREEVNDVTTKINMNITLNTLAAIKYILVAGYISSFVVFLIELYSKRGLSLLKK
ncbi:uncharacterized protein LOC133332128 [Musca vetustissima]|uniref:uncharacterized protein LOC133332128 n=1 Tax=Musca vetustissima TaxID=27455 RepID=UPI002AB7A0B4|nr:uncharacterized protein LOC133332128 [Musca vetustissima]